MHCMKNILNIYGQVNRPGLFDYKTKMTVADLILEAGGFTEGASVYKN